MLPRPQGFAHVSRMFQNRGMVKMLGAGLQAPPRLVAEPYRLERHAC
jgi:hypothetical protein